MTIIRADFIMTMNEDFLILEDCAVAFDDKIVATGASKELRDRFPDAVFTDAGENSVVMPGLVNTHVHLEFSANKTALGYGDFIFWLKSVVFHRDELVRKCAEECIRDALYGMMISGTTTAGAISSFGTDLDACVQTPLNIVYFNEVLGSNPSAVDALFTDFGNRLEDSMKYESKNFTPAVSVHSPYSTHPVLAKKAVAIAKERDMIVSTHFMESSAEREWIDRGEGDFNDFFERFMPGARPVNEAISYLEIFKEVKTLFTHAVFATKKERELMQSTGYITHCPVSNRLLNNGVLDINGIERLTLGTDGLSSNISLNLWDEMRAALYLHSRADLSQLPKILLLAATKNGAQSLGKKSGTIRTGYDADIITVRLPDKTLPQDLPLHLILHTKMAQSVYIGGEEHGH